MGLLDGHETTIPAPVNDRLQSGIQTIHTIPLKCSVAFQISITANSRIRKPSLTTRSPQSTRQNTGEHDDH
jgi:hypothetical protein